MSDKPKLMPCPFCGGPAILRDFGIDHRTGVRDIRVGCYVAFTARGDFGDAHDRCQVCPMIEQVMYPGRDIVAVWNHRAKHKGTEAMLNKDEYGSYEAARQVFDDGVAPKYGVTRMDWGFGRWLWIDRSGTELEYWRRLNEAGILTADGRKRLARAEKETAKK